MKTAIERRFLAIVDSPMWIGERKLRAGLAGFTDILKILEFWKSGFRRFLQGHTQYAPTGEFKF
jgi:hypothetical protein